ncbi:hypothetical protein NIES4103_14420 [Nostoc sp. NIES-4103]|nr:hypothetical protein NIES4103_14420 [Nostoc sp. NIES-4103]
MLLTPVEIEQVLEQVKNAFPNFTNWQYNNQKNQEYEGFSVWGEFAIKTEELTIPRRFYITLDTDHEDKWQGCLTIGQPSYLWSSADVGDAHLVNTDSNETLQQAIAALKTNITELFQAFC